MQCFNRLGIGSHNFQQCLGRTARKNLLPLQPGDVPNTYANVDTLINDVGYKPTTSIESGVVQFVDWYKKYYKV